MSSLPRARRRASALAVVAFLVGGVAGCGSDSDGDSGGSSDSADENSASTQETPAEEGFVVAANAVCETAYVDINEITSRIDPSDPEGSAGVITDEFLPAVESLQAELEGLTPDEDVADAYQEALDNQAAAIEAITADPLALFEVDADTTNGLFDAIGLTACGSASSRRGGGSAG